MGEGLLVDGQSSFLEAWSFECISGADDGSSIQITSIGAATTVVVLFPRFRTPAWRPFRAFMFVMMGMSAVVPVLHGVKIFGAAQMERQIGLSWLVTQGLLYILGAGIYAVSSVLIGNRFDRVPQGNTFPRVEMVAGLTFPKGSRSRTMGARRF